MKAQGRHRIGTTNGEHRPTMARSTANRVALLFAGLALVLVTSCAASVEVTSTSGSTPTPAPTSAAGDSPTVEADPTPTVDAEPTATPNATPTVEAAPTATATPVATPTVTPIPEADLAARLAATKLLVDLGPGEVEQEIAALRDRAAQNQLVVAADHVGCDVLDAYATPTPDEIVVEFFFDAGVQCVRSVPFTALFVVDVVGVNSRGEWDYREGAGLRTVETGLQEKPTPVPLPPGASLAPTVERVSPLPIEAGVGPESVLTDPAPGDAEDVLAVLEAANSSGAIIVTAEFQGCTLIDARAIPMPTQVVVQATFDANIQCFRAFEFQAFFLVEPTGVNSHGAWNYTEQPEVTVEYIEEQ